MDSSTSSSTCTDRYSYNPKLVWNHEVKEYLAAAYGREHFAAISDALTRPCCYSCIRVNTLKTSSDAIMAKLKDILDETGTSANINCVEIGEQNNAAQVQDGRSSPIQKCPYPGLDNVLFVHGSGPHNISCDNQSGQPIKEVIVSRKCAEAVLRGAQVYVPGVLACSAHVEKGDKVAVSAAVEQPVETGGWSVGITRGAVLQGLQSDPQYQERKGLYIGQGIVSLSRAGIFRVHEGIAVDMTERVYKLPSFNDVLEGEIFLQNLPSIVTARVLDPQPGERILDMCAAPGGKTTAIALLMRDKGEVIAIDRSHNKVMDIVKLAAEMDLHCIKAYRLDALKSIRRTDESSNLGVVHCNIGELGRPVEVPKSFQTATGDIVFNGNTGASSLAKMQTDETKVDSRRYSSKAEERKTARRMRNGPGRNQSIGSRGEPSKGFLPNSFDRVLLDAPCSALGLRPRLFAGKETMESLNDNAKYQRKMFDQAVQLVRPGGVIVYSTCTINPGENEALVRYALDTFKFLSLGSQHPKIGGPGIIGSREFNKTNTEKWLTESEAELVQRFDPSSPLDTIGFFIAKFDVGQKDG